MEGRFLLDVVVRESSSILQLLSSKDQPLLVWGDALLVLNLGLDILNGVRRLHLQSDGLASQGLHKDLHSSSQSENQVEGRLLLDVVVRKSSSILQLLSSKDQPLLVWGNSLLVLLIKKSISHCDFFQKSFLVSLPESLPSHSQWSQRAPPPG